MSANPHEPAFVMLCTDLGLLPENLSEPLKSLLQAKLGAAEQALREAGVQLNPAYLADLDLLVCYAAWLYRGRVKQLEMPLMLQRMLHNRQVSQATQPDESAETEG